MAPPFYQPAVDALKEPSHHSDLKLLIEFMEAVDKANTAKLPIVAAKLRGIPAGFSPYAILPDAMFVEALRRLLLMPRAEEFSILFDWNVGRTLPSSAFADTTRARLWTTLLAMVPLPSPALTDNEIAKEFDRTRDALTVILASHAASEAAPVTISLGGEGELDAIEAALVRLSTALMFLFERALNLALVTFGKAGKDRGKALLELHARWSQIRGATFGKAPHIRSPRLQRVAVDLTKTRLDGSKRLYLDAIPPHEGRTFEFAAYDRKATGLMAAERGLLDDLFMVRSVQLRVFLWIFGEFFPPDAAPTTRLEKDTEDERQKDFTGRRVLIDKVAKKVKTLDIRTEDAMADFLCAFFAEAVAARPKMPSAQARLEAWDEMVLVLAAFVRSQTMHTDLNLAETPIYLDRLFPGTLHGQQLFDCGVYAVKLAYILLKLAPCLIRKGTDPPKPDAAFLLLPIHIGLVVRIAEFPPLFVQNDVVKWLAPPAEKLWRKEWDDGAKLDPDPAAAADKDRKFFEDVASQHYVSELDMPIKRIVLDKVSSPPKKAEVWAAFEALNNKAKPVRLFSEDVEKATAKNFQFDLKFLEAQAKEKAWYNARLLPFWNRDLHQLWVASVATLHTAAGRTRYAKELEAKLKPIKDAYEKDVRKFKQTLSDDLRKSGAVGKDADRITVSKRLKKVVEEEIGPLGAINRHLKEVKGAGAFEPPGFATEDGFLRRIGGL
ncbi:hypothetical protein BH10PSE6_BH10PSE6_05270 [soil metagenome]